ncbi:sodium/potassium-transporting ATPase subunit beta-1-like [Lethenteron reissneri]|uniref:sodium/potassium-transporting ATPase subunit beta-1-like n=1 Tax=Lethenteron reissneri TaxID=7753 RepID=UPI002AB63A7A|nr:sodium/potassium-transporting ATPase subunit beta-1-like [Lethenteron reissneri]
MDPSNRFAGEKTSWKVFVWNPETRQFLGRTGSSWFKIILFYIVFYGFLAAIFIGTIQALLLTINKYTPQYQDRILPPGLSVRPQPFRAEIYYSLSERHSIELHNKSISSLLDSYSNEKQTQLIKCGEEPGPARLSGPDPHSAESACRFQREWLGDCSGLTDPDFGYSSGNPCVIIKLNRVIGFLPEVPKNDTLPIGLKYHPNVVPVACNFKREEDKGRISAIRYFGAGGYAGFPMHYYPFLGRARHAGYVNPLVAVQLMNVTRDVEVRLECRIYAENVPLSARDRLVGRVDLKLLVRS